MPVVGTETTNEPKAGRKEWIALAVLALPLLLVSMDVSVLYFAVPFISRDLSATATQQLWIFDIYGFVLAGLLITMGALGDRIGRRRLLMFGAGAFGVASVAAAYATSPAQLIAARALLGIGGATLMPSTLALIRNMFHDSGQRAKAIAVWSAVMLGGVSLGPVLSGILLEHFWWGSVFLMNTPAMLLLLTLAPTLLPEFTNPSGHRFDLLSSALSLGGVLPVIFGIKRAAADGFGVLPAASITGGLLVGWAFVARQRRASDPMIDLGIFANRGFTGSLIANTVAMFALVGNAVFMTQYLQLALGMSPLRAALWSLLPSIAVAGAAPLATALAQRGPRGNVIGSGLVVGTLGFLILTRLHAGSPLIVVILGAGVLASGMVMVMTLVADLVISTVTPERAGSAAALMETCSEFGGALGIAVLGSIGTAVYGSRLRANLPDGLPLSAAHSAAQGLAGAQSTSAGLPGSAAQALLSVARHSFIDGLNVVSWVGAGTLALAAVVSIVLLRDTCTERTDAGN
ncbi:MAG: major facilitator superfamily protein [Frankiales bacterium]|nr:major facilitator superfamily protein [Frankiales bacterium]